MISICPPMTTGASIGRGRRIFEDWDPAGANVRRGHALGPCPTRLIRAGVLHQLSRRRRDELEPAGPDGQRCR